MDVPRLWKLLACVMLIVGGTGCSGGASSIDASIDARPATDANTSIDAGLDAGPAARTALDVVSAGGRVAGGTLTLDVEIGHAVDQQKATGGTLSIEGGAVVKP